MLRIKYGFLFKSKVTDDTWKIRISNIGSIKPFEQKMEFRPSSMGIFPVFCEDFQTSVYSCAKKAPGKYYISNLTQPLMFTLEK